MSTNIGSLIIDLTKKDHARNVDFSLKRSL